MNVKINEGSTGPWAWVDLGLWCVSVWPSSAILVLRTDRGNTQLQHSYDELVAMGPKVAALYGFAIDGVSIRTAIEVGKAAITARNSEAA